MATYTKDEAQEWAKEALKGQWTTLITPFTPDDDFDDTGMRHNIRHIQHFGPRGPGRGRGGDRHAAVGRTAKRRGAG